MLKLFDFVNQVSGPKAEHKIEDLLYDSNSAKLRSLKNV